MEDIIIPRDKQQEILREIGKQIVYRAKTLVPVDLGDLQRSLNYRIEGNTLVVFSPLDYAQDMEFGTPPSDNVNEEGIKDWARRHNIKNPQGTVNYIKKHGIKIGTPENPLHITWQGRNSYRPFLRPAVHQTVPLVPKIVKEVLAR